VSESKKPVTKKKPAARGLGRGLSALMADVAPVESAPKKTTPKPPKAATTSPAGGVQTVAMDRLTRNPDQPRKIFDKKLLAELTESIRLKGVLQPILVRPIPKGKGKGKAAYQIVAGERRWQASLKAGLTSMPVLIRELSDQEVLEIGVVENVQRADLNPIEEARAYRALIDDFGRTQEDVAKAVGKSRPHVANMMRLLSLPSQSQSYLEVGKITPGHARAIIAAPDPDELADYIVRENLSVRAAEDWVRRIKNTEEGEAAPKAKAYKSPDIIRAEQDLTDALGLNVDLRHKGPGGELRIKYKTGKQLEAVLRALKS